MSVRLNGYATIVGETKEALTEALARAIDRLEAESVRMKHRVVWDTIQIGVDAENIYANSGTLLSRSISLTVNALCVEEPGDDA